MIEDGEDGAGMDGRAEKRRGREDSRERIWRGTCCGLVNVAWQTEHLWSPPIVISFSLYAIRCLVRYPCPRCAWSISPQPDGTQVLSSADLVDVLSALLAATRDGVSG